MSHSSTLRSHILEATADPDIAVYVFENEFGDRGVTISILRDMENRGKDSFRIKMPVEIFDEIMSKGREALKSPEVIE